MFFLLQYETQNIYALFTPGLTYFASSKIGLEISLGSIGYNKNLTESTRVIITESGDYYTSPIEAESSGLGANFGLNNATISVKFYLGSQ